MCKHADNPCPGCKKHRATDPRWMFFTEEERREAEARQPRADS